MHKFLVEQWNETVSPEDTVYFLGDFALNFKYIDEFLPELNGKIHFYAGNHDSWHSMHKGWRKKREDLSKYHNVGDIKEEGSIGILDTSMSISHFPAQGVEGTTDHALKYANYRPRTNWWHIHGHVHERWQVRGKNINVSWDAWHKLLTLEDIQNIYLGDK